MRAFAATEKGAHLNCIGSIPTYMQNYCYCFYLPEYQAIVWEKHDSGQILKSYPLTVYLAFFAFIFNKICATVPVILYVASKNMLLCKICNEFISLLF